MSNAYKFDTSSRKESQACPGVSFILRKMTEGRRLNLKKQLTEANSKLRTIIREQDTLFEKQRTAGADYPGIVQDNMKIMDLQGEYETIMMETVNPATFIWGCKQVEGLESEGKVLTIDDWQDFPTVLYEEILTAVNSESQLKGAEIKNSELPITSGQQEDGNQKSTTADTAS